jgi:2-dehydro-3-deoxyphosphogluconate aldolase / (4S)-4-hydroxy-2-oxoglutarate aldolase
VVPVVVLEDAEPAVSLARALVRGGIRIIEVALRSSAGLPAIERLVAEEPQIVTGAGTVTTPKQAEAVRRAGAQFIVTPGSPDGLLAAALDTGLPLLAGASTLTEIMRLMEHSLTAMKFFPAEAAGGTT